MSDVNGSRPGNVKTRPLGEVKMESVYFEPSPIQPSQMLYFDASDSSSQYGSQKVEKFHENIMTSASVDDTTVSNTSSRKPPSTHAPSGSGLASMEFISSLVTPRNRSISIPQPRTKNIHGNHLRIRTAPQGFGKDQPMDDPCPSPVSSDGAVNESGTVVNRNLKPTSSWGEYRRQLSTARRNELRRRITALSKCDAVDISDQLSRDVPQPFMILSQMPQREKEYDDLVARAQTMLKKKKTLPSVFITKQKRPGAIVKEINVFSRALKEQPGCHKGQIDEMIVGKSMDQGQTEREDPSEDLRGIFNKFSRTSSNIGQSLSSRPRHPDCEPPSLGSQTSRSKTFSDLDNKSLPRLHTGRPGDRIRERGSRASTGQAPDVKVIRDFNGKCDHLQNRISPGLVGRDKMWSQSECFASRHSAPVTGSGISVTPRRQPVQAVYRSFQRMQGNKQQTQTRRLPARTNVKAEIRQGHEESKVQGRSEVNCTENDSMKPQCQNDVNVEADTSPQSNSDTDDLDLWVKDIHKGDVNNNEIGLKTFHLTELDDMDFTDSDTDSEIPNGFSDSEECELNLDDTDPTRQIEGTARYQGPSSKMSEDDASNQVHGAKQDSPASQRESYRILKALDKDVYVDFEHKKYRRSGTLSSLRNSDNPRYHFVKVKVADTS